MSTKRRENVWNGNGLVIGSITNQNICVKSNDVPKNEKKFKTKLPEIITKLPVISTKLTESSSKLPESSTKLPEISY